MSGRKKKGESPKRRNLRSTCHDTVFFLKESLLATVCRKDVWVFFCLFACLYFFKIFYILKHTVTGTLYPLFLYSTFDIEKL